LLHLCFFFFRCFAQPSIPTVSDLGDLTSDSNSSNNDNNDTSKHSVCVVGSWAAATTTTVPK